MSALAMTAALDKHKLTCCREALGRLLQQYAPMVRSICAHRLGCTQCDDLQQEAFLRVLRSCERVRDRRHLPAYLRTITKNLCSDRIRAKRAGGRLLQADDELLDNLPEPPANSMAEASIEISHQLREEITHLPDGLRVVLESFYFQKMDYASIAAATGLTIAAVGQRLSRARRRLREALVTPRRAG